MTKFLPKPRRRCSNISRHGRYTFNELEGGHDGKAIRFAIEEDDETEKQAEADDDFDIEQPELKIRSSQAALSIADDLNNFCETLGDAELVSALSLVTRRLETLRLKNVSQKKSSRLF